MGFSTLLRPTNVRTRIRQVSEAETILRLPKGRKDWRRPRLNYTTFYKAKQDPQQSEFRISTQRRFITYNDPTQLTKVMEVYVRKMKIPENATASGRTKSGLSFIKATTLSPIPQLGTTIEFTIQGDVEVGHFGEGDKSRDAYSIPVAFTYSGQKLEGQYNLNKTNLGILVKKLGDETSHWVGARFTMFVAPTRNPQTNGQTITLSVLADSVRTAKSR